jgi:hypothetical protein
VAPLCGPEAPQGESYDQHRSWLKAVEYALTGVPWVGSDGVVYEKLDGKGGFMVENSSTGWTNGLAETLDNLAHYKELSRKLMPWARDNLTMIHMVDSYVETFNRAFAERNAANKVRLPNMLYAGDRFEQVEEIKDISVSLNEEDYLPLLADYQSQTHAAVNEWCSTMTLTHGDIDIGQCLEFPLLQELNAKVYAEVMR